MSIGAAVSSRSRSLSSSISVSLARMEAGGARRHKPAARRVRGKSCGKDVQNSNARERPFALSLSKGALAKPCFDKLSTNGGLSKVVLRLRSHGRSRLLRLDYRRRPRAFERV